MTKGKYRNYQEFFSNYLGGWTFENGDQILTIKDAYEQEVRNPKENSLERKLTVYFEEQELPLIANKTNAEMIAKVTGCNNTGDWIGKKIKVGMSKVRAFGDEWDAVRVRNERITAAHQEPATEEQVTRIQELADDGQIKMDAMLKYYSIKSLSELTRKQAADLIRQKTGEVIK